jgi:hypothetical protein
MSSRLAYWLKCDDCGQESHVYKDRQDMFQDTKGWVYLTQPAQIICPECSQRRREDEKQFPEVDKSDAAVIAWWTRVMTGLLLRDKRKIMEHTQMVSLLPVPPDKFLVRFQSGLVLRVTVNVGSLADWQESPSCVEPKPD